MFFPASTNSCSNFHDGPFYSIPQFSLGYIKANLSSLISSLLAYSLTRDLPFRPSCNMPHLLYNTHPPPDHPYLHATSVFLATLQLYDWRSWTQQMYVISGLGTPPSVVIWAALPLR